MAKIVLQVSSVPGHHLVLDTDDIDTVSVPRNGDGERLLPGKSVDGPHHITITLNTDAVLAWEDRGH